VDEFVKRLDEIRARAAEIAQMDEINEEARAELRALRDERTELEAKIEDVKLVAELTAEVEQPKAEEAPAEETVEETVEEVVETVEETVEEPTAEAIAAAVSTAAPTETAVPTEAHEGLTIVASSNAYGMSVGSKMEVSDWERVSRLASKGGEGRFTFGNIVRHESGKALSSRNSAIENTMLMSTKPEHNALQPLTAAACYCGPFEVDKSIRTLGMDDRPVAGLFASRPVTGPFQYIQDLNLGDVAAGVNLWTCADQEGVVDGDPGTYKPIVELGCADPVTVDPYAIVAAGRVSLFQQVSHPELVDDFITKLGIQYARLAEQALLDKLRADSTVLTYGLAGMGLLHEIEGVLGHLSGLAGYTRRIDWNNYALILPPGLMDALITDEHRRGFSRGANRAAITSQLRELGVGQIIEARDADSTAEANYTAAAGTFVDPGNTVAFDPCNAIGTWTVNVVPVSAYSRGESTLVEAGYQRDATLTRQNMVQWFMEGHEYLEKMSPDVPSFTLELTGAGTGGTSALVDPEAC
jgi:hypothetical protein